VAGRHLTLRLNFSSEDFMRIALTTMTLLLLVGAGLTIRTAGQTPNVTFLDHEKVAAALAKGTSLMRAPNVTVSGAHRTGPGQVEVHDKETDVLYIMDGEATFVSGGTMVGGKVSRPDQHLGTDIQGGTTQHLVKGDAIVVQAGTPHWFKEVPKSVSYFVVKVLKN
jgi:mannose-6-phosphate isomerase-like protein (cupin superfamily)